jgi:prepilin-type N-terminal cleavage/methylation domain-containing protein
MEASLRGFTIVEVMIALAVSSAMLVAGISFFSSTRQDTEFDQAVYDLQSKLGSYVNMASTKAIPGYQNYTCSLSAGGRPVLGPGTSSGNCTYLGQAIQVIANMPDIYSYPVFGTRLAQSGPNAGNTPTSLADASPTPAMDSSGSLLLVDQYTLSGGLTVRCASSTSAQCSSITQEEDMVGIYSTLQDSNVSGNETTAVSYNLQSVSASRASQATNCIEQVAASGCTIFKDLSNAVWHLCVWNKSRSASIDVKGSSVGTVISVNLKGCS